MRFDADKVNIRKQIRMKYDAIDVKLVKQNKEDKVNILNQNKDEILG